MSESTSGVPSMPQRIDGSTVVEVVRLTGGASNETLRVTLADGRLIALRRVIPKSGASSNITLQTEGELLDLCERQGVPAPRVVASSDEVLAMTWVEGEALGRRIVTSPELANARTLIPAQLLDAVARLQASAEVPSALTHRTAETFVSDTLARYDTFDAQRPVLVGVARWLRDHLPPTTNPVLVHGDLRVGNIMVDQTGLAAILDWELAHLGDPEEDLAWFCTNSWRFGRPDLEAGGIAPLAAVSGGLNSERFFWWRVAHSFWWGVTCLFQGSRLRTDPNPTPELAVIGRRVSEAEVDCLNLLVPATTPPVALPGPDDLALYSSAEMLTSVGTYLKGDFGLEGADRFGMRVAANAVGIAAREAALGPSLERDAAARLADLGLTQSELVEGLHGGRLLITDPEIAEHLRLTTVGNLAIDQPRYPAPPISPGTRP